MITGSKYRAEVSEDKKMMRTPGVDFGPTGLQILFHKGKHYVIRNRGHQTWGGLGMPFYYVETSYALVKLEKGFMTAVRCEEPGRKWKKCLTALIEEAKRLK